jgi:nucleotide-binding universal stress UspA family protein
VTLTEKNVGIEARVAVKRVLVPVDKSGYKEKIMAYAVSLGKAWGAEITAVHVIDPGRGIPGGRVKEKEQEREQVANREAEILHVQFVDP